MQSFWFAGLLLLVVCGFGETVPLNVDQLENNNDSETRLIVPPEMTSNYFELLKDKSEKDTNFTKDEKADSTPMNFLRSSEDNSSKTNLMDKKPLMAFDGTKQTPIFITIPIYITSGSEGMPIIATSIEKIIPSQMASKTPAKTEIKKKQESSSSSSVDGIKQETDKN